jgi:hypothetical protein
MFFEKIQHGNPPKTKWRVDFQQKPILFNFFSCCIIEVNGISLESQEKKWLLQWNWLISSFTQYSRTNKGNRKRKEEASMVDYSSMLEQLKQGEIPSITVPKEDFLDFRNVLVQREDFKHFRGAAYHHGITIYTYTEEPSK